MGNFRNLPRDGMQLETSNSTSIEVLNFETAQISHRKEDTIDVETPRNTCSTENATGTAKQVRARDSIKRLELITMCLGSLANGFKDAGTGVVIPQMKTHYQLGYDVVSLIFVGQAIGFIFAAAFFDGLLARLGTARALGLANLMLICGYIPILATSLFPLIPIAFCSVGFGAALTMPITTIFCRNLEDSAPMLAFLHGCYGIGGTIGPIVATAMVSTGGTAWNQFYFINLGFAVVVLSLSIWSCWSSEMHMDIFPKEQERSRDLSLDMIGSAWNMRAIILGAIFIFAHQGTEVSISSWIVSFLIDIRGGSLKSVGYVSAGFWGGITVGTFASLGLAQLWGRKPFVHALICAAFIFQLSMWLVPSVIGNAIATAINGTILGLVYPCAAALFLQETGKDAPMRIMVVISALGSLGGASATFITGLLAEVAGIFILQPTCILLYVVMSVCWYGIPGTEKERDNESR